jgi:hypothetical protein
MCKLRKPHTLAGIRTHESDPIEETLTTAPRRPGQNYINSFADDFSFDENKSRHFFQKSCQKWLGARSPFFWTWHFVTAAL